MRFYDLVIDLSNGRLNNGDVRFHRRHRDRRYRRSDVHPNTVDPEAIRITPFPGLLYWTSEGNAELSISPFVRVMTPDGKPIAAFDILDVFKPGPQRGIRNNLAFESLPHDPVHDIWYTAVENALIQDGPAATLDHSSPVRILALDGTTGKPRAQYVYIAEPVALAPEPADAFTINGLPELLAVAPDTFLALERSFSTGVGNDIRLFLTTTRGASDISGVSSLRQTRFRPMRKRLVLDLSRLGVSLDNVEGMTLGPDIDGQPTLILVADNNFSTTQRTQFLAFRILGLQRSHRPGHAPRHDPWQGQRPGGSPLAGPRPDRFHR